MKKSTFTILLAFLFLVQGIAQQVEQQQRSLITKRTADWCPYCGTWGWSFFQGAIEQNEDKAILMAAHYDGGLANAAAEEITDNFGGFYQPKFFLNETQLGVTSGNVTAKLDYLKPLVDSIFEVAPVANSGFDLTYENGELQAAAKVKFFQAAQGEYYLGLYLLEDNVTAYQASIGNNAVHKRLFRFSFTEATFGLLIASGDVAAGQEFSLNFALPIGDPTGHDYEVAGIIWKKEGDKYLPVNVWSTKEIGFVSETILNAAPENALLVAPSVASDFMRVYVRLIENQPAALLEAYDLNGRKVAALFAGAVKAGETRFELNRETVGGAGLYFLRLKTGNVVITKKVIFL